MRNLMVRRIAFVMAWVLFGVGILAPGVDLSLRLGIGVFATGCFALALRP